MADKSARPRIFMDADALIAGAASPNAHSASLALLRMAEITLIEAVTSEQVISECERNLREKMPKALPAFQLLVQKCLRIVPDPSEEELANHHGKADAKDLPILVAASQDGCATLATFNLRHFSPGLPDVEALKPGELALRVRYLLASL